MIANACMAGDIRVRKVARDQKRSPHPHLQARNPYHTQIDSPRLQTFSIESMPILAKTVSGLRTQEMLLQARQLG